MTAAKRGRPSTGVPVLVRIPPDVLELLDLEAEANSVSRAELIRGVLWEWCRNGGYSVGPQP